MLSVKNAEIVQIVLEEAETSGSLKTLLTRMLVDDQRVLTILDYEKDFYGKLFAFSVVHTFPNSDIRMNGAFVKHSDGTWGSHT
jgi:hypothetical protein